MIKKILEIAEQKEKTVWILSLTAFLFIVLLSTTGLFSSLENSVNDYKFVKSAGTLRADSNIVMVSIDQKSLDFFDREKVGWPWPREFYSYAVDYLNRCGAKAIVFDIDFSGGEAERLETDAGDSEARFAYSIETAGNVVLGTSLTNESRSNIRQNAIDDRFLSKRSRFCLSGEFNSANAPLSSFQKGAKSLASTNVFPDKDGVIRKIPLQLNYRGKSLPGLSFSAFQNLYGVNKDNTDSLLGYIPLSPENEFIINWYGAGGPGSVFKYYSIHSVIVSYFKTKNNMAPDIAPFHFRDKIVIVGGTAVGLLDHKVVPVSALGPYPGMELHATVLSNLMNKDFISVLPSPAVYAVTLLFCFLTTLFFFRIKNVWLSVTLSLAALVVYCTGSFLIFHLDRIIVPVMLPASGILMAFIGSAVFRYSTEGRQKKELKRIFNRYLNPHVVEDLIKNPDQIDLEGREVTATTYFSDIENFTNISETLNPKLLVRYLNKYFSVCTNVILRYNGLLDKYIGDSVMAVFGAPNILENHALNACLSALDNLQEINNLYKDENSDMPFFNTRIGIHTGCMVVGNIGTESHLDYTVIGDSVNLASRLEGVNKIYGTNIIISESTWELVKDKLEARLLDNLSVKGKSIPIRIYELLGRKGTLSQEAVKYKNDFENAVMLCRSGSWEKAEDTFRELLKIRPEDKACEVYINRLNELQKQGDSAKWDEVTRLKTK